MNKLSTYEIIEESNNNINDEYLINNEYQIDNTIHLGSGSYGKAFPGYSIKTKLKYAIKVEQNDNTNPQLANEYKVLKELKGEVGIPNVYYYENCGQDSVIVMDLLGPNLEEILKNTKTKKFNLKSVYMIGMQVLARLFSLHQCGFIHRDLKPANLLIGANPQMNLIYLIDYGLSKKFTDDKRNGEHIPYKEGAIVVGTINFISLNTHNEIEQSRRDDLESLAYILIYFALGELPWSKIKIKNKDERREKIFEMKNNLKGNLLKNEEIPYELRIFLENIYNMSFPEIPNYELLKRILAKGLTSLGLYCDNQFDWSFNMNIDVPVYQLKESLRMKEKEKEEMKRLEEIKEKERLSLIKIKKNLNKNKEEEMIKNNRKSPQKSERANYSDIKVKSVLSFYNNNINDDIKKNNKPGLNGLNTTKNNNTKKIRSDNNKLPKKKSNLK